MCTDRPNEGRRRAAFLVLLDRSSKSCAGRAVRFRALPHAGRVFCGMICLYLSGLGWRFSMNIANVSEGERREEEGNDRRKGKKE